MRPLVAEHVWKGRQMIRRLSARSIARQALVAQKNDAKRRKDPDAVQILETRLRCMKIANDLFRAGWYQA